MSTFLQVSISVLLLVLAGSIAINTIAQTKIILKVFDIMRDPEKYVVKYINVAYDVMKKMEEER